MVNWNSMCYEDKVIVWMNEWMTYAVGVAVFSKWILFIDILDKIRSCFFSFMLNRLSYPLLFVSSIMNFNCKLKQYHCFQNIFMEIIQNRIKLMYWIGFFLKKKSLWLIITNLTHINTHKNTNTHLAIVFNTFMKYRICVDLHIIGFFVFIFVVVVVVVVNKNTHITLIDTYP